ncbi:MAG: cytochrome b N-terminal domain-containing protein, partial [Ignavibacteriae bacterium]|nr:cytochrome b N-terminal domain-containing protein [Ignavibacteriota bacterium]
MTNKNKNIFTRFKNSIYQGSLNPTSEQDRLRLVFKSLILHLHPPTINEKVIKFNHTFGLGGMVVVLICIQIITGLLLRFTYEPFPGRAYDSILHLQNNIVFGQLIRNLHHWSAVFLIIIVLLHLLRVFFTGAFHGKRQFNWVIGVLLFVIIIFSNFTGYLLPWDQLSYWAINVSTSMLEYTPFIGTFLMKIILAGKEVGNSTLLVFYNLHTGIFPILLILIMAFHFWRVRKAGGVVVPKSETEDNYVSTIPNLVAKEFVVALILIAFIFTLSILFNAPLLEKANPNFSPNPAKAPWYFMGVQELMIHFHPLFSAIIIPVIIF